jgi:hypothetical protein
VWVMRVGGPCIVNVLQSPVAPDNGRTAIDGWDALEKPCDVVCHVFEASTYSDSDLSIRPVSQLSTGERSGNMTRSQGKHDLPKRPP